MTLQNDYIAFVEKINKSRFITLKENKESEIL